MWNFFWTVHTDRTETSGSFRVNQYSLTSFCHTVANIVAKTFSFLFIIVLHNFIMDNSVYHPSLMIPVSRENVVGIINATSALIKDLDTEATSIHEQVAMCCNRGRPLCRDVFCTAPCIPGDPWDTNLRPRLQDCENVQEWLQAHGVEHGHPFYRNYCFEHINKYTRIGGDWVEVPDIPTLQRNVVRRVIPVDEQEGPLYYIHTVQEDEEEESSDQGSPIPLRFH